MVYALASIFTAAAALLIYGLLVRRAARFQLNRAFLLLTAAASLTLPAIDMGLRLSLPSNTLFEKPADKPAYTSFQVPESPERSQMQINTTVKEQETGKATEVVSIQSTSPSFSDYSLADMLLFIWATGSLFFFCKTILSLSRISSLIRKGTKVSQKEGFTWVQTPDKKSVFVFGKYLMAPELPTGAVLRHELTHIRQGHTLDLLFFELLITGFWWNPFLFLFRRELRFQHECLADKATLKHFSKREYLCELLNIGEQSAPSLSHAFFNQKISKRMKMLNKISQNPQEPAGKVLRVMLFSLPLLLLAYAVSTVKFTEGTAESSEPISEEAAAKEFGKFMTPYFAKYRKTIAFEFCSERNDGSPAACVIGVDDKEDAEKINAFLRRLPHQGEKSPIFSYSVDRFSAPKSYIFHKGEVDEKAEMLPFYDEANGIKINTPAFLLDNTSLGRLSYEMPDRSNIFLLNGVIGQDGKMEIYSTHARVVFDMTTKQARGMALRVSKCFKEASEDKGLRYKPAKLDGMFVKQQHSIYICFHEGNVYIDNKPNYQKAKPVNMSYDDEFSYLIKEEIQKLRTFKACPEIMFCTMGLIISPAGEVSIEVIEFTTTDGKYVKDEKSNKLKAEISVLPSLKNTKWSPLQFNETKLYGYYQLHIDFRDIKNNQTYVFNTGRSLTEIRK